MIEWMLTGSTGRWMSVLSAWALYRNTTRFAVGFAVALFAGVAAEVPPVTPVMDEAMLAVSVETLRI
jgi:hypothetical protein